MEGAQRSPLWRPLLLVAVLGHLTIWYRAVTWYTDLPDRFPIHFDGSGAPNSWTTTGPGWFLLPVVAWFISMLIGLLAHQLGHWAEFAPRQVNLARKELFLRLSPMGRRSVVMPMQVFMIWVVVLLSALFLYIVEGMARVAIGAMDHLPAWPVLVFLAGTLGALLFLLNATSKALDAALEREGIAPGSTQA
jgi:uncharacterized membrane protein